MNHTHFDIDIHVITFVRVCVCGGCVCGWWVCVCVGGCVCVVGVCVCVVGVCVCGCVCVWVCVCVTFVRVCVYIDNNIIRQTDRQMVVVRSVLGVATISLEVP